MKFVLFNNNTPGIISANGVIDISDKIASLKSIPGQSPMNTIIENIDTLSTEFKDIEKSNNIIPYSDIDINVPISNPNKIFCMGGNFTEFGHRPPGPMWGFLKSTHAIIGPNGIVELPQDDANIFHHEAELVLVFGKSGKNIQEEDALDYVFGYTCGVDVSARMPAATSNAGAEFVPWRGISPHKSHPTFAPIGPYIVTKDEISDPQNLDVKLTVDGELRGNFNTSDMAHSIAKSIAFVSQYESFEAGDILYTGTNHQGLGAMQDGDSIKIEVQHIGEFSFTVSDSLKRKWARGVDEETAEDLRKGTGGPGRRKRPLL